MSDTLEGADPDDFDIDEMVGDEMVCVRWLSGTRGQIGGKRRYRADTFMMPASQVSKYGKDLEIVYASPAQ